MKRFFRITYPHLAPLCLRLIIALYFYLSLKAQVYQPGVIEAFAGNLKKLGLPAPLFMAWLGTWSVLISYALIIAGWFTRYAAIPVIIYFIVAIIWGHIIPGHTISKAMPAVILLLLGVFFLLNGPGKPSVDEGL
jgi:putative oxidoreductase